MSEMPERTEKSIGGFEPTAEQLALKKGDPVRVKAGGREFEAEVSHSPIQVQNLWLVGVAEGAEVGNFYPLRHATPLPAAPAPTLRQGEEPVTRLVDQQMGDGGHLPVDVAAEDDSRCPKCGEQASLRPTGNWRCPTCKHGWRILHVQDCRDEAQLRADERRWLAEIKRLEAENARLKAWQTGLVPVLLSSGWEDGQSVAEFISRLIRERDEARQEKNRLYTLHQDLDRILPGNGPLTEKARAVVSDLERVRQERNAAGVAARREHASVIARYRQELDEALEREKRVRDRLNEALPRSEMLAGIEHILNPYNPLETITEKVQSFIQGHWKLVNIGRALALDQEPGETEEATIRRMSRELLRLRNQQPQAKAACGECAELREQVQQLQETLRSLITHNDPPCAVCRGAVEESRWIWAAPTCERCLPPAPIIPTLPDAAEA